MKISERIKQFRKENNLTQSEFAEMIFVTKQAVSKWENERGIPDISLIPELAKVLNVSVDELMGVEIIKNKEFENTKNNNFTIKRFVLVICVVVLFIIFIFVLLLKDSFIKFKYKNNVEGIISYDLPKIQTFDYYDLTNISLMNSMYPNVIYHFIFEGDKIKDFEDYIFNNELWVEEIEQEDIDKLPHYIKPYVDTCDLFYITENIFICYQDELNRLIVCEY